MILANLDVQPLTIHLNSGRKGGATLVAYPMSEEGNITHVVDARQVLVSTAQCSEKDFYCKKVGRKLAIERATDEGFVFRFPHKASAERKIELLNQLAEIFAGQFWL